MNKVRIKAIRQTIYQDLIEQYENPIEHACDIKQGQQWISINGKCPEGLCPSAWESMQPFVESLARGKGNFFDGWMKNPMSAMISCNDGFRPFSFYIEVIEEQKPGTSSQQTGGVASAEKGNQERYECHHLNGVTFDNRVENVIWLSRKEHRLFDTVQRALRMAGRDLSKMSREEIISITRKYKLVDPAEQME